MALAAAWDAIDPAPRSHVESVSWAEEYRPVRSEEVRARRRAVLSKVDALSLIWALAAIDACALQSCRIPRARDPDKLARLCGPPGDAPAHLARTSAGARGQGAPWVAASRSRHVSLDPNYRLTSSCPRGRRPLRRRSELGTQGADCAAAAGSGFAQDPWARTTRSLAKASWSSV